MKRPRSFLKPRIKWFPLLHPFDRAAGNLQVKGRWFPQPHVFPGDGGMARGCPRGLKANGMVFSSQQGQRC